MPPTHDSRQNHILAALPESEFSRIFSHLELTFMPLGHALSESGLQMRHVYFPTTAIISRLYVMENGASAEISMIGNDGLAGIFLFMGGETMPSQVVVQSPGHAYRMRNQVLMEEFERGEQLQHLLLRYTQAVLTQIAQTAVCNRHHSLRQQLCRWLLMRLDRLSSNEVVVTQEQIGHMLGVRREGITEAAGILQKAGLIKYHRGHIIVLDRAGLEAQVCECYTVVRNESDRLLPNVRVQKTLAQRHDPGFLEQPPRESHRPTLKICG